MEKVVFQARNQSDYILLYMLEYLHIKQEILELKCNYQKEQMVYTNKY